VVVQPNKLVDVPDGITNLTDGRVLESTLWIFTAIVKNTCLLVDVLYLQRLKLTALSELYVLQSLNINNESVRLCLGDALL